MGKMQVLSDCVLWDGDQIGTIEGFAVEIDVSEDNFENCEIDEPKRREIRDALGDIKAELKALGYNVFILEDDVE